MNYKTNALVKCSDTDIVIILLGNMHRMYSEMKIHVLLGSSKTQWIIDINELHSSLSPNVCKVLPGFHDFTGCDYNPSFFRKAKSRSFQFLSSSTEFVDAFSKLSNQSCNISEILPVIDKFVCLMYSQPIGIKYINIARYTVFKKRFGVKKLNESFNKKLWEKLILPLFLRVKMNLDIIY